MHFKKLLIALYTENVLVSFYPVYTLVVLLGVLLIVPKKCQKFSK